MLEKNLEAKELDVAHLFSDEFVFNIPRYQRPLSWRFFHFMQLFDDIADAITENMDQYFIGSIILQQKPDKTYDVIDGQQRLTALAVLMAVIRDNTKDEDLKRSMSSCLFQKEDKFKNKQETMRIIPWHELKDVFRKYIYAENGTTQFLKDLEEKKIFYKDIDDPRHRLSEAIRGFTAGVIGHRNIESYVKFLFNNVYLVYIKTSNLSSAYRLFTVLNTRGLSLTTADILKAENLSHVNKSDEDYYSKLWRDLEDMFGRSEVEKIITYLKTITVPSRSHYWLWTEYQSIFQKGLLKRGAPFFDRVKDISQLYDSKILSKQLESVPSSSSNRYRIMINLLNSYIPFNDWIPPILAFADKFRSDESLLTFLLKLEKKIILEWADSDNPNYGDRPTTMLGIIREIKEKKNPDEVFDAMLSYVYTSSNVKLDLSSTKDLRRFLGNWLDSSRCARIHRGKFAKYILSRIDLEEWDLNTFEGYYGEVSLEHILPQNPPLDSTWQDKFNDEEHRDLVNTLGNLVLLSGPKNSESRNYDFEKKKKIYFKRKGTSFKTTLEIEKYFDWDVDALVKRNEDLKRRIYRIYSRI
ncbi:MAG TPA: DUF262 domain-containing HNH endonuclease family protein [Nitrososphaera sp.]|nr:DUF262 domain-containing HNH endonuclease family protein [Nitrososphaera sp.]